MLHDAGDLHVPLMITIGKLSGQEESENILEPLAASQESEVGDDLVRVNGAAATVIERGQRQRDQLMLVGGQRKERSRTTGSALFQSRPLVRPVRVSVGYYGTTTILAEQVSSDTDCQYWISPPRLLS
jgi:hypothetical protein